MKSPEQQIKLNQKTDLAKNTKEKQSVVPSQYRGMPSEIVEELWQNPIYIDEAKNKSEIERRQNALEEIKKAEQNREMQKDEGLRRQYANLSDEQKAKFFNAQKDAVKIWAECVQGKREIDDLSSEESFVLQKLKMSYENFKKNNPEKNFSFDFSKDLDKSIYNNLVQRLAFEILNSKRRIDDQKKANVIREKIGIPKQEILDDNSVSSNQNQQQDYEDSKKEEFKDIFDVHKKIYFKKRITLSDDAFAIAHGINPETGENFELVSGEIGVNFDAHGIAKTDQLKKLLALLKNGIDKSKPFYTAPFEIPDDARAAMGAAMGTSGGTAYKEGIAVITSGYKEKLSEDGIKHVFINDIYGELIPVLIKNFPKYNIHLLEFFNILAYKF